MCITIRDDDNMKVKEKKTEAVKDVNHNTGSSDETTKRLDNQS